MTHNIISVNPLPKPIRAKAPIDGASEPAPVSPQPKPRKITWGDQTASNESQSAEFSASSAAEPYTPVQRGIGNRIRSRTERSKQHYRPAQRQFPSTSETPKIQVEQVERNSKLERLRQSRLIPNLLELRTQQGTTLEHLSIRYNPNTQRFWLADAQTGRPLTAQAFATLKHCQEAALELEHTFEMSDVLRLRSPETMERIEELVQMHRFREHVG
ncbi:MAG TPA: hypothetical protein V6D19_05890 [Stenomitos sp.]